METITERLRELWENSGLQQKDFAAKAGLDRSSVNLLLNGKRRPDIDTLKKICEAFEVSADWLIGTSKDPQPNLSLRSAGDVLGLSGTAAAAIQSVPDKNILNEFLTDAHFQFILEELATSRTDEKHQDYHCYRAIHAFEDWWNPVDWGMPWEEAQKGAKEQ